MVNFCTTKFVLFYKGPSEHPSELQVIMQTSSTVTFQWKELECYEENGPITGYHYRVYYSHSYYTEGEVDRNTTKITLLHNNMEGFSVAAVNKAGMGEHCPTFQVYKIAEGNEACRMCGACYDNGLCL